MGDITEQVGALLTARRQRLPVVRAEIASWRRVDTAIVALAEAVADLVQHPATPPEAAADLDRLRLAETRVALAAAVEPLHQVERRIGRGRLCIGVGGAARSGKSTVVQSLSGLTDARLPTRRTGAVTAVRTRIVHTTGRVRAVLAPHTAETFRSAHLHDSPSGRLDEIQAASWSYEGLLNRQGRPLELIGDELDRLPEYVTYPAGPSRSDRPVARRYLAIREARIECAFPHADIGAIEIVDLPGFDGPPGADRHHVAALRHDADVILLIKRTAGWDGADEAALVTLDEARGFVGRRADFVLVVLNTDPDAAGPADDVDDRDGTTGHRGDTPRTLTIAGRDPIDVSTRLLRPLLNHLSERLPAMDLEVHAGARALTGAVRDEIIDLAVATKVIVDRACDPVDRDLHQRAGELHTALSGALRQVLDGVRRRAGESDPELIDTARQVHRGTVEWARSGLGVGYDLWSSAARRTGFVHRELDRVRSELDDRYRVLDGPLRRRMEEARTEIAEALAGVVGPLLGGHSGTAALTRVGELADGAEPPCTALRAAVDELLAVRLDYSTHLRPRVRDGLDGLEIEAPGDDAAALFRDVCAQAEQTTDRILDRLLREATLPGWVVLTAVERFVDAVVGSEDLKRLARSYRHDLWPGRYRGLRREDASIARIVRAADDLLAATAEPVPEPMTE
jgi:hypothetical protein